MSRDIWMTKINSTRSMPRHDIDDDQISVATDRDDNRGRSRERERKRSRSRSSSTSTTSSKGADGDTKNSMSGVKKLLLTVVGIVVLAGVGCGVAALVLNLMEKPAEQTVDTTCGGFDCPQNSECVSQHCVCLNGYYNKSGQCVPLGSYHESCQSNNECSTSSRLICATAATSCNCPSKSVPNYCDCSSGMYWSSSSKLCTNRKTHNQSCNSGNHYECIENVGLSCIGICSCANTHYWNGTSCVPKKTYQDGCTSSLECHNLRGLSCPSTSGQCNCPNTSIAFKCDCDSKSYWDFAGATCTPRKAFSTSCSNGANYQCIQGIGLICNATCKCPTTHYWTGSQCAQKKFSGACSSSQECQDYLNPPVTCISNQCQCPSTHYPSNGVCLLKKLYQVSCSNNQECNSAVGLVCPTVSSGCNCPSSSVAFKCDCSSTASYWNGNTCVARKAYLSACTSGANYQCKYGVGLICNASLCRCNYNQYWNSAQCVAKKFSGSCLNNTECQDYLNPPVTCRSGQCLCPSTHYPSNGACLIQKTYQATCSSSNQCNQSAGLSCPSVSTNCNCPTTSIALKCDCNITHFWDGKNCVLRKSYYTVCTMGQNYQCKGGVGLICNGTCKCDYTKYWNGVQCVNKKFSGSCVNTTMCQDYISPAVTCISGQCSCPSTHYPSSGVCLRKKTYQSSCSANIECDNAMNLNCPSVSTNCNCPITSTTFKCDCNITHFWNGATCVLRKSYFTSCTGSQHYQCIAGIGLICNGTCKCNYTQYWDGTKCVNKKFSGNCVNTTMCQDYLSPAVTCISGQCSCPATHYPSSNVCLLKKTYQSTCAANIECDNAKNLNCPSVSTNCNCPTTSVSLKCDCNITHYWTGSTCAIRKSYLTVCTAGQHYQCKAGVGLICNGTCKCSYTQYWDGSKCVNKKFSGTCANTTVCQDYLSPAVTCISGQCSCPSTHYPSSNVCLLKKSYQVSCAANIQCQSSIGLVCPTVSTKCNCPTTSGTLKCDCSSTSVYWDGSKCAPRISYGSSCSPSGANYKCRYGSNMICSTTCTCPSTHYWYSTNATCLLKKTYLNSCASSTECNNLVGLVCPSTNGYCSCPTVSTAKKCDCQPTSFWDYTVNKCVARKTYGQTCQNGLHYQCVTGKGLQCTGKCTCAISSFYWNGATCASKLYLMFYYPSNYTRKTITTYAGSSSISSNYDVRIQEKPTYSIFVMGYSINRAIQYNRSRSYIKYVSHSYSRGLHADTIENGNVYIGLYSGTNRIMQYKSTLSLVSTPLIATTSYIRSQFIMRYDTRTNYFYTCCISNRWITAFTTSFTYNVALGINVGSRGYTPYCVHFYTTSAGVNLIYVGTSSNLVLVYRQTTYLATISPICNGGYPWNLYIDQDSSYMVVSCFSDSTLRLWTTDGSKHTYTGKFISVTSPTGGDYDSIGRFVVGSSSGTVTVFSPWDDPYK